MIAAAKELSSIYAEAADELSAWLRNGTDFQKVRAANLIHQVDAIMARTGRRVVDVIDSSTHQTYTQQLDATRSELLRIGLTHDEVPIKGFFNRINERAVEKLAGETRADLLSATQQLGERAKRAIRRTSQLAVADKDVSRAIAKGLITGGSVRATTSSLAKMFSEGEARRLVAEHKIPQDVAEQLTRVNDGFIQVGKVHLRIKDYAATVAVTRMAEATSLATEDRCEQSGVDTIIITGPATSDFCDLYVGKVFSISGNNPDYPSISSIPGGGTPFHPHCTHGEAPFVTRFATPAELKRAVIDDRFVGMNQQQASDAFAELKASNKQPRPKEVTGMKAARSENPEADLVSLVMHPVVRE